MPDVAADGRGDAALRLRAAALRAHRDRGRRGRRVTVEAGQKIAALLGVANRDPAVFDEPDEFRVDRDPNPHLAFGVGVHFCLGAPLARMELAESLAALFDDLPRPELAGEPESRGTFVLRGYRSVPVRGNHA